MLTTEKPYSHKEANAAAGRGNVDTGKSPAESAKSKETLIISAKKTITSKVCGA